MIRNWVLDGSRLFGAGVFGDCLGAFADCVLCQFTRQQKSHRSLDLPRRDCRAFVVVSQPRSLRRNALENVVDEAVHNAHGLAGDSSIRVHLLQHLVDVNSVAFLPLPLLLLIGLVDVFLSLTGFLHGFTTDFRRHDENSVIFSELENSKLNRIR